jgi:hypothetical protein|tara:strand:+ start:3553 stop:3963 length:411 start_codon:yes stop_codon:yes gene_type:complete
MLGLVTALATPLLKGIFGTIDKAVVDKDMAIKLKNDLQQQTMDILSTEVKASSSIIRAEIKSDSYLAKNWRPITMLTFVVIIANNYIIYPYLQLFFNSGAMLDIPPDMWGLLKIGLGGYVVGRSVEKGVQVYKGDK